MSLRSQAGEKTNQCFEAFQIKSYGLQNVSPIDVQNIAWLNVLRPYRTHDSGEEEPPIMEFRLIPCGIRALQAL